MDVRLANGDAEHLSNLLVVPGSESPDRRRCEAPGLAAVEQCREHTTRVNFVLEPPGCVPGAEERSRNVPRAIEASFIRASMKKRAEVDEGLGEANDAAVVQHEV